MSGRFVRSSKYRHVFGRPTRKEQCYDNLRVSKNAWDSNLVKVNPQYVALNWEAGGGGAFAVLPIDERGKLPERIPLFRGHTAAVLDTDWNPFNDSLIASSSDDGKVFLWRVPEGFSLRTEDDEVQDIAPVGKLSGHPRKVGHVLFNPAAENILASSAGDFTIKLWDIEAGSSKLSLKLGDMVQSLSWSADGSMLVTTSRDKKLRFWDVRQEKPVHEVAGHSGAKNSRATWMGEFDRVATTGFSKMSDRQLALWDIRAPREPINGFKVLDAISGVCVPHWDDGTRCLYLAGKGDGNVRYFEYENDKFEYLSEYKSSDPQRGIAFMPKRGVNIHENEVVRMYKTVNDTYIEPVSFIVPRRAEVFQDDIYPPTTGLRPAMSATEWHNGKEAVAPKIDMASLYEGGGLKEVSSDDAAPAPPKPAPATQTPESPKKKEPEPTPAPTPAVVVTGSAPHDSIKAQSASMSDMASKYADSDEKEDGDADETSSFEEVPKPGDAPTPRISLTPAAEDEMEVPKPRKSEPPEPTPSKPAAQKATTEPADRSSPTSNQGESSSTILEEVTQIKALLGEQTRTIAEQSKQISALNREIDDLKSKIS